MTTWPAYSENSVNNTHSRRSICEWHSKGSLYLMNTSVMFDLRNCSQVAMNGHHLIRLKQQVNIEQCEQQSDREK